MTDAPMSVPRRFPAGSGSRFLLLYMALFLPFSVATPYLQNLLRLRGFERDEIGLILGFFEAMAVLAPPLWGAFSDRCKLPRLVLGAAIVGCFPSFLLFGLVKTTFGAVLTVLLFGLFYRPLIPLTDGITLRYVKTCGGDYGKVRLGGSLAFIFSILILEAVGISRTHSGNTIIAAMCIGILIQLCSLAIIPTAPRKPSVAPADEPTAVKAAEGDPGPPVGLGLGPLLTRPFLCFTLSAFLGRVAMMSYYGFFSLFLKEELGFENVGYIWVIGPLSEIPVMYYSRRIMDRIGVKHLFALGLLGCALRLYGFSIASTIWLVLPLQLLHSLTFGAFHTASVTYVSESVPANLQSTAQTIFAAVTMGAGGILGGVLGGWVARHLGFKLLYCSFGTIAAVALVLLLITVPSASRPSQAERTG